MTKQKSFSSIINSPIDRRRFLKFGGAAAVIVGAGIGVNQRTTTGRSHDYGVSEYMLTPEYMLVVDTTRCSGCRRCETVCSTLNQETANPDISGIKVGRNQNFGMQSSELGTSGKGLFGNFRIVPETCIQCEDPVLCAEACPVDAISMHSDTRARIIDEDKCVGCADCVKACPWEMIAVNRNENVAVKCHLCHGNPQCAAKCPNGAISLEKWQDRSKDQPIRNYKAVLS